MILWRPSINNQRYAFTPLDLGDSDVEDDDDMTLSDAFCKLKIFRRIFFKSKFSLKKINIKIEFSF